METRPMALILGWAGSQDKHLRPIIDWYASLGYSTRQFTANAYSYLRHPRGIEKHIAGLVDTVERDIDNPPRPLIVHLFSNNGFTTLSALLRLSQKRENWDLVNGALRGVVIDSAPSFNPQMSSWQGAEAYARGIAAMATPALSEPMKSALTLLRPALSAAFWVHFALERDAHSYMRSIADTVLDTTAPILLLAGRNDSAVPLDRIQAFANACEARGHQTRLRVFDTEHVQMVYRFKKEYFREVSSFLDLVFSRELPKTRLWEDTQ